MVLGAKQTIAQDNLNINPMLCPVDSMNMLLSDSFYIWGSTVVKGKDGKFHMFYSRWPHGKRSLEDDSMNYIFDGFSGWLKYCEIAYAVSDSLTGPFVFKGVVLKGDWKAGKWDRYTMTNPQIRCFEGKYYLYYVANSYDSTFNVKRSVSKEMLHWYRYNCTQKIGVLIADSPEDFVKGKFEKSEEPLMQADGKNTFEISNNPSVTQGPDGKYFMIFKSRVPEVGHMTMWIATADKPYGPFTLVSSVFTDADMSSEDACIWYDSERKQFYAAVKYYSNSGKLIQQFGGLGLLTSKNGFDWSPAQNPLISLRVLKLKNGKTLELENLERPFIVTDEKGQPIALFAAFSVKKPGSIKAEEYTSEYNTGNVGILLKNNKK